MTFIKVDIIQITVNIGKNNMSNDEEPRGYFENIACIDLETSGLFYANQSNNPAYNPLNGEHFQIVSCGIIIAKFETLEIVEKKYFEVKHNGQSLWTPEAEAVHGLSKEHLEKNGISEEDLLYELGSLFLTYFGQASISTLGHNHVRFDLPFIEYLADKFDMKFKFANRCIDTNALGSICWKTFNSDDLFWSAGLPERKLHNALEDIEYTLEVAKRTRMIFEHGLNHMLNMQD